MRDLNTISQNNKDFYEKAKRKKKKEKEREKRHFHGKMLRGNLAHEFTLDTGPFFSSLAKAKAKAKQRKTNHSKINTKKQINKITKEKIYI